MNHNIFLPLRIITIAPYLFFLGSLLFFVIKNKRTPKSVKNYFDDFINSLNKTEFKITMLMFFIFISTLSILYLFFAYPLLISYPNFSFKLINIAFSGLVVIGTLAMALSSFYSIKELRIIEEKRKEEMQGKEESRKNQIIKIFFRQIKNHLEDLKIISDDIISSEKQGISIFTHDKILDIFYDFLKISSVFEDISGYNSLFSELQSPCELIFREYYRYLYNFIQDTKKINEELINSIGYISDENKGSIFEYINKMLNANSLQEILSEESFKKYDEYCKHTGKPPSRLKEFINLLYTPNLLNIKSSSGYFIKLRSFIEYPIFLMLLGYECLFCILKNYSVINEDSKERDYAVFDYKKIKTEIIEIAQKSQTKSEVMEKSLKKIDDINEKYKNYIII
jgi:hypothetical protein